MPGSPSATSATSAIIAHDASSAVICWPSIATIKGGWVYSMRGSNPSAASSPPALPGDPSLGGSSSELKKLAAPSDVNATMPERSGSTTTITSTGDGDQ